MVERFRVASLSHGLCNTLVQEREILPLKLLKEGKPVFLRRPPEREMVIPAKVFRTSQGSLYCGHAERLREARVWKQIKGSVQLLLTSPPFPLNRKKSYGNLQGEAYIQWLSAFGPLFRDCLAPTGSLVIEMGNAFETGSPTMSTLPYEALLALKRSGDFHLCQELVCFNPARLPSPAQWVTIERIRLKDSFTRLWWLSISERPQADNRRVLLSYSEAMKQLLLTKRYNSGMRPSEHQINPSSFAQDNGGAIAPNVLVLANTTSNDAYSVAVRNQGLTKHPARMPEQLATFFIRFLTQPGELVLDPFAGSNTTGFAAESLGRKWCSIEVNPAYAAASMARFSESGKRIAAEP